MPRTVKGGLIQVKADISLEGSTDDVKKRMIEKHLPLIEDAGRQGVQVLCLQELFYGPYFCAEQTHQIERVGAELRKMMPFVDPVEIKPLIPAG